MLCHKFSRITSPAQLSFDFLAAIPAPFPATALVEQTAPTSTQPLTLCVAEQLANEPVVIDTPAPQQESLYAFLARKGKLDMLTLTAVRTSRVHDVLSDQHLFCDLAQAVQMHWLKISYNPDRTDSAIFAYATVCGQHAAKEASRHHLGAVYVPGSAHRRADAAAIFTCARNPLDTADYTDSTLLAAEDEIDDRADQDFLDARLTSINLQVTPLLRKIAAAVLIDRILDAEEIAARVGITVKTTRGHINKLLAAFDAANDRDLGYAEAA